MHVSEVSSENIEGDSQKAILTEIEAALDALFSKIPLPHPNRTLAIWHLLTVVEDCQRNLLCEISDQESANAVHLAIDRLKYSLRHGLDRILKEVKDKSWEHVPRRIVPMLYEKAARLVMGGTEFADAIKMCTAAHEGTVRFGQSNDVMELLLDPLHNDKGYSALELIGSEGPDELNFLALLFSWIRFPKDRAPDIVWQIADTVRLKQRLLTYDYQQHLAIQLAQQVSQQPFLIPDEWQFPWGGRSETTLLLNALSIRCIYHVVAVHFGAVRKGLRGRGESNICLIAPLPGFIDDLRLMCSLSHETIGAFTRFLTYGQGTRTPDPALQPLIPLSADRLAVPCMHILSSNQERNLLSLQARVQSSKFDAASALFEKAVTARMEAALRNRWPLIRCNINLTFEGTAEEIDLLIADPGSRTMMVCELRWMLGAGDPREVQNRKRACRDKVTQLERKVRWLRIHAAETVRRAFSTPGDSSHERAWTVEGVVVIENFGGARSANPDFPVMPLGLFELGMLKSDSLSHFGSWSRSLIWLPQEGVHFQTHTEQVLLAGKTLKYPAGSHLVSRREYIDFVSGTIN